MSESKTQLPLPPGNMGLPIVGETLKFLKDIREFATARSSGGPITKTHLFGRPTIVMSGAEAMRYVLTHENEFFQGEFPPSTVRLLGPGSISVVQGATHQNRRKVLQQVFGHKQLAAAVPLMDHIAQQHIDQWLKERSFAFCPKMNDFTFHLACALILGDEANIQDWQKQFQYWTNGLFSLPIKLPFTAFGRAVRARDALLALIEKAIMARKNDLRDGTDALTVLLQAHDENGDKLSDAEIADQLLTLLFAGHETSSSALGSFCLLMTQYPDVLERLRREQHDLRSSGPLTIDLIRQMPYLDQVMKEVLRFIPPVGGGFRKVIADCEFGGYRIPKDWRVLYSIGVTHQNSEHFANPEKFDPDRFSPERAEDKKTRFSWIPFGGGARLCLGMEYARLEMAVLGAKLVRDYSWIPRPLQDLTIHVLPTPRPKSGLVVDFIRRTP